jgi:hypothetical protein
LAHSFGGFIAFGPVERKYILVGTVAEETVSFMGAWTHPEEGRA